MRAFVFILLILHTSWLAGQSDCNSDKLILTVLNDEEGRENLSEVKSKNLSLFSQIDLSGRSDISIIYERVLMDSSKFYFSTNIELLQNMAENYSEAKILQSSNCENSIARDNLIVIENKTLIHEYRFNEECNLLTTNCGIIKCDIGQLTNKCREVQVKQNKEYFENKQSLSERIEKISKNKNTIGHALEAQFVKGIMEVEFVDVENKVNSFLGDRFWSTWIKEEELSKTYKNPIDPIMNEEELSQIGKILQILIKRDSNSKDLEIIGWSRKDKLNHFQMTVEYHDESFRGSMLYFETKSESKMFELKYITIEEIL